MEFNNILRAWNHATYGTDSVVMVVVIGVVLVDTGFFAIVKGCGVGGL